MTSTSRHLVDPELLELLAAFPSLELSAENLPQVRAMPPPTALARVSAKDDVGVTKQSIPGPPAAPNVDLMLYAPHRRSRQMPCVLHIHGGGYVLGNVSSLEPIHRQLSSDAQCIVASVEYRLAPETRFPGAVEDCYAALRWLHSQAESLGIEPRRIGVMGESAGGGLAAALALLARDRGEYPLAFQHLIYPMLDDRTCAAPPHPFAGEFLWTPVNNAFGWSSLLGVPPGSEGVSPYAAPARAFDLAGLPPTYLSTATLDLFVEENLEYAKRLIRAGVPVELHVYPGAFHAFDLAPDARVSKQARRDSLTALQRQLAGQGG
jgi:acetyl esterase/lipase